MKLQDLTGESLQLVQGIEGRLRHRQRKARFSVFLMLGGIALEVLLAATKEVSLSQIGSYMTRLLRLDFAFLFRDGVPVPELVGFLCVVGGVGGYAILRWTSLLLDESREPFRYTFSIKPFERVAETPPDQFRLDREDRFHLLAHDLVERLNSRIGRLSILEAEAEVKQGEEDASLTSHVHIEGHYTIREVTDDDWSIQVMPRIRIGPPGCSSTLAPPVSYPVTGTNGVFVLDADTYNQIVERVYSRVATEVYRQIEEDVRNKMSLFPTPYLRSVALYHEAEDFARSNTIDAYDRAIDLYRQALRYFNLADVRPLTQLFLRLPLLWRKEAKFIHREAWVKIGYAKCLIYRRKISALTGRHLNPIFEVLPMLEEVIADLSVIQRRITRRKERNPQSFLSAFLTFPPDSWRRLLVLAPGEMLFERQRETLFEAYVVAALAHFYLKAKARAWELLESARAVDPKRSETSPLYLLAEAEIEPDLDKEILLFQRAAEISPEFQIAKYLLADASEMRFRRQNELSDSKAARVIELYEDVILNINPGNVAAIAAEGHLLWLLGHLDRARRKLEQGREIKSIAHDTYIGELNYGIARIAAEEGRWDAFHDAYSMAIAADPGVAAFTPGASTWATGSFYAYISPEILRRYRDYKQAVLNKLDQLQLDKPGAALDADGRACSQRTLACVRSMVLNDYGNACFNCYLRLGNRPDLDDSLKAYQAAIAADPSNAVAHYNLASAQSWSDAADSTAANLKEAEALAPSWPAVLVDLTRVRLKEIKGKIKEKEKEKEEKKKERTAVEEEIRKDADRAARSRADAITRSRSSGPGDSNLEGQGKSSLPEKIKERIDNLEKEISDLNGSIPNEILPMLRRALERTRLFALCKSLEIDYDGRGVRDVIEIGFRREQLVDHDIHALRLWMEILATNDGCPAALRAAVELGAFLQGFFLEDFDRDCFLYDIYSASDEAEAEKKADASRRIARQLRESLEEDPVRYDLLQWSALNPRPVFASTDQEDLVERQKLIERAMQICMASGYPELPYQLPYLVLLGDLCLEREYDRKASEHYLKAVALAPDIDANLNRLGNAYHRAGEYPKAVAQFQAAISKNSQLAVYHANLAGSLRELRQWSRAARAYRQAIRLEPENQDYRTDLKLTLNDWGNQYFEQGEPARAMAKYQEAIAVDPADAILYANLSNTHLAMQQPGRRQEALEQAVRALEKSVEVFRPELGDPGTFKRRLEALKCIRDYTLFAGDAAIDTPPAIRPLAIEVAWDLVSLVEGQPSGSLAPEAFHAIAEMRERIDQKLGVVIPMINIRDNANEPPGAFSLLINEIPVARGTISPELRFYDGPRERLVDAGVEMEEAVDRLTGDPVLWIAQPGWDRCRQMGIELRNPIFYVVRHLEDVLRSDLSVILGHQETLKLFATKLPKVATRLARSPGELTAITRVLRGLLREQVSIARLELIWQECQQGTVGAVERLRSLPELAPALPGKAAEFGYLRLSRRLERELAHSIRGNGTAMLALAPEKARQVQAALRSALAGQRNIAILVRNAGLRPYVRALVRVEHPSTPVLSQDEVGAGAKARICGEIRLPGTRGLHIFSFHPGRVPVEAGHTP